MIQVYYSWIDKENRGILTPSRIKKYASQITEIVGKRIKQYDSERLVQLVYDALGINEEMEYGDYHEYDIAFTILIL